MSLIFGNSSGDLLADRRFTYALGMLEEGDAAGAADLLLQAAQMAPNWPPIHFHAGVALTEGGHPRDAVESYRRYLALDPADHMGALVKLSLIEGASPGRLPDGYVKALFDEYAPRFDDALLGALHYKTPWQIAEALERQAPKTYDHLLDLGCGTGLAAEVLKNCTSHRVGVDLSPGMVDQAKAKDIYDDLIVASLEDYLDGNRQQFDLIVCADVLVYIGALEQIMAGMARALRQGGLIAFSVQKLESGSYILGGDHRYAHSQNYIESCARKAGLTLLSCDNAILRKDGARDIEGIVFVFRRKN